MALYERRILNDPDVRLAYSDPLVPLVRPDEVTLELSNEDAYFDTLDLRGEQVTYDRFDAFSQEQLSELSGTITDQRIELDRVILRSVTQDLDDLQTLLPKRLVEAGTFPLAHAQQGLGKPIPIVLGNAASTNKVLDSWELPYVGEDTATNRYDYLLGEDVLTNASIYRNTVGEILFAVPASEYTITSSAYPGFTVARFALRQANFSGGLHRIFGAADGLQAERNPVIAIQSILGNTSWGLGLAVNSASFATGASNLTAIGSLYCDGVIAEQRPALDWLSQIFLFRGMSPSKNTSGQWTISVDTEPTVVQATFGHGEGQQWANVVQFNGVHRTPVNEATRSLILDYRKDRYADHYVLSTATRNPLSFGKDLRLQNDFIRDRTTADKVADYLSKTIAAGDQTVTFTSGQEARKLRPGDLINYESTKPVIDTTFRVTGISRHLETTDVDARGWNSGIYTYTAGTLPTEPSSVGMTDFSRQSPTAATSLSIIGSGTETDGQNAFVAFQTLQYNVASESWGQSVIRYRRNGTTNWQTAAVDQTMGNSLQTKITGLITGLAYDYQVSRVNVMNAGLVADTTLTNITAPTDAVGPSAPTALAITDQHLKTLMVEFTPPADKDVKYWHWEVRTAASGGGSLVDEGDTEGNGAQIKLTLNQIAYSTTRYLRIRGHDFSGNTGTYSSSLSFSFSKIVTGDVGSSQVTTTELGNTSVTTAKRQLVNSQTVASSITFAANEMAIRQDDNVMTHNLGVLTSMTTYLSGISGEDTSEVELSGLVPASGTSTTFDTIVCAVSVSTVHSAVTINYTVNWDYW